MNNREQQTMAFVGGTSQKNAISKQGITQSQA
jgi:hypothetical protein